MTSNSEASPPKIPFVFSVGVTGHRWEALSNGGSPGLAERIEEALRLVRDRACALHAANRNSFADAKPRLIMISPLADGADQIAAEVAMGQGFELHVVLPQSAADYRASFGDDSSRLRFDRLVAKASCVLQLPGDTERPFDSFVMAGRGTLSHANLLLAIWDGLPPRGRGGTGEIVQTALTRGLPVLHVPVTADERARLLWSAFDPTVVTVSEEPAVQRPADTATIDAMLKAALLPPDDRQEREFIARFLRERRRKVRLRIEYPLLLGMIGVRRFGRQHVSERHAAAEMQAEWARYRSGCSEACGLEPSLGLLEQAYAWSDRLATYFAQTYRSGHIFNFVLGGLAVCLGLSAFLAPHHRFAFAATELVITIAIILNAHIGTRNEWHRRWLDYRQLAERLRPMRSLQMLGIAAPDAPGTPANPVPRRWIDWYAAGIWRALGCPGGALAGGDAPKLATAIAEYEVAPQVAYHERNARQIATLDRRLGAIGTLLFLATFLVSAATLAGLAADARWVDRFGNWLTLVSAGFPALATAVFGIRFQADFGGDAVRSQSTADTLRQIERELRAGANLSRAADLTEQAGRVMLANLDEWRLINQQRDLSVG